MREEGDRRGKGGARARGQYTASVFFSSPFFLSLLFLLFPVLFLILSLLSFLLLYAPFPFFYSSLFLFLSFMFSILHFLVSCFSGEAVERHEWKAKVKGR